MPIGRRYNPYPRSRLSSRCPKGFRIFRPAAIIRNVSRFHKLNGSVRQDDCAGGRQSPLVTYRVTPVTVAVAVCVPALARDPLDRRRSFDIVSERSAHDRLGAHNRGVGHLLALRLLTLIVTGVEPGSDLGRNARRRQQTRLAGAARGRMPLRRTICRPTATTTTPEIEMTAYHF